MDWVRVETSFPRHPKLAGLSDTAKWHFLELWCYAAEQETDGRVPRVVAHLNGRHNATKSLLRVGLLCRVLDDYELVGFTAKNPTKAEMQAKRAAARDRVARHRNAVTNALQPPLHKPRNAVSNATEVEVEVEAETTSEPLLESQKHSVVSKGDKQEEDIDHEWGNPNDRPIAILIPELRNIPS